MHALTGLVLATCSWSCAAFSTQGLLPANLPLRMPRRATSVQAGLFDMFGESEEQKRAKDEAFAAQQEMLARRRDPEAMAAYMAEIDASRVEAAMQDKELKDLQKGGDGDTLDEWKRLKDEGKVTSMDEMERDAGASASLDPSTSEFGLAMPAALRRTPLANPYHAGSRRASADSSRFGSDGLIGERIDEKLPYIDSGYVDESSPDLMGGLKKLFGGDKS